ncbi:MAG: carboxymuconolactone decarboxylase family protein, partial [Fibrobacteria bacterium]
MLANQTTPKSNVLRQLLWATAASTAMIVGAFAAAAGAEVPSTQAAATADIQKTLGFVPQFFEAMPPVALPGIWQEMKEFQLNPKTALNGKSKELIGLGVSAQIPCRYCIEAHTEFAKLNGAKEAELGEAVAMAAITRHWSTVLNGVQTDEGKFRGEIAKIIDNVKKGPSGSPAKPVTVTDGATALQDISQTLGLAPEFMRKFPESGRAGAWRLFKDVQLGSATELKGKDKELVGLAVASQVPCKFCVIAHTEFAKLNGAS